MWNTDTFWFEIALVSIFYLLGNIFLGHFEERSPNWRKLAKYLVTVAIIIALSQFFGRAVALIALGLTLIPVFYVHAIVLPKKGINGWTGEPKAKYYESGVRIRIFLMRSPVKHRQNSTKKLALDILLTTKNCLLPTIFSVPHVQLPGVLSLSQRVPGQKGSYKYWLQIPGQNQL